MKIIAVVESDECGPAVVLDSDQIRIAKFNNIYIAAARCSYTDLPVTCEITEEQAQDLIEKGVECISVSNESFNK